MRAIDASSGELQTAIKGAPGAASSADRADEHELIQATYAAIRSP